LVGFGRVYFLGAGGSVVVSLGGGIYGVWRRGVWGSGGVWARGVSWSEEVGESGGWPGEGCGALGGYDGGRGLGGLLGWDMGGAV